MASFEPRPNGVKAVISLGRKKKLARVFPTQREAEEWARKQELAKDSGNLSAGAATSVAVLLEIWYEREGAHTDSAVWNLNAINRICKEAWTRQAVAQVTPDVINKRNRARMVTVKETSVAREMNLISKAFTYAMDSLLWIKTNPCRRSIKLNNHDRRDRLITPGEIAAVRASTGVDDDPDLHTLTARVGACFLVSMETGVRSGELLRVRPEHYSPERKVLRVAAAERGGRKTARSGKRLAWRDVPLTDEAIRWLDKLLATRDKKQPYLVGLTDSQRDALWRKARDRAGIEDLQYRDLKHTACTKLAEHLDVIALSHAVGTKNLKLLRDTYYSPDAERQAQKLPARLVG
ncbi:tyrosine-type recombinase/integrase [Caldimonas sp. KR1-144]|uniref:tyrosine-type recombinase/integrase n=1 Tax=Caldimonas sp. KR1-144 TaxID=3400911 RepID=UPI003C05CD71